MERSIVHMDMDTFFVSCERRQHPELNGMPLIVGGTSDRAVVASCSVEARKYGVRAAMPMRYAKMLCPEAKVINMDMDLYSRCSQEVTEIIEGSAPVMERASIDEYYLDVSGMDKFIGCYKWTTELAQKVFKEMDLPISFGLSINKTVSKIATTEGKPQGKIQIEPRYVRPFLNPLSIRKIPGLGDEKYEDLARSGIRIIQSLAEMDVQILHKMYGKDGIKIWDKANGVDEAPVEPYKETKALSRSQTFDQDTIDIVKIKSLLSSMVEELSYKLRDDAWLTSVVAVKIKYANFDNKNKQKKIPYTSIDKTLKQIAEELFDRLYDRRMRIRLIGISFSGLVRSSYQINLFDDTVENIDLYCAIDKMRKRFGFKAVMTAQTMNWHDDKNK